MSAKKQVFILGGTGYIGGTVLVHLLQHHSARASEITALVRNPAKAPSLALLGVKILFGTLEDGPLIERQASKSDVVIACASMDHVGSCEAILRGLKKRHEATGTLPAFIHTSGVDVVHDYARGMYSSDTIWDDTDLDQLEELPVNDLQRLTDPLVLAADEQGYARTHIVLPATIYGYATGPLVKAGVQNPRSIEIPKLVGICIARKRAGMVGLGLNMWSNVHIHDIGDLYVVLYEAILDGRAGHGDEGMYFGTNGEETLKAMSERVGGALVEFGVCRSDERTPTSFDATDYATPGNEYLRDWYGTNTRCRANRARELGWQPTHGNEDMLKSIRDEVERQLKRGASALT